MKRLYLIFFSLVSIFSAISAQNTQPEFEQWIKLSPELAITFEGKPWDIRWRPDDHIFLPEKYAGQPGIARMDFMLGYSYKAVKLFNYTKVDEFWRAWTGLRFDWNFALMDEKLHFNIQERYFWGLNPDSDDHYYLIHYIRYMATKNIHAGVLSYGKWEPSEPFLDGLWFVGPSVEFKLPHHTSFHVAYTKSLFDERIYMAYAKFSWKISIKSKKE